MNEEEFQEYLKKLRLGEEEARKKNEIYRQEIVDGLLKIPLEGLKSDSEKIVIADDLEINRVSTEEREIFFTRAVSLDLTDFKSENNWYFATLKFKSQRQNVGGPENGDRILMMAILFSLCCEQLVKINKGQGFGRVKEELESLGITKIPSSRHFYGQIDPFTQKEIQTLVRLWPLFKESYIKKTHFVLVARRFYYSLIRNQWEDQLVDLIIALEGLLLPEISETNKGGKLAKRVSILISDHYERGAVAKIIRSCYDLRNDVVHGDLVYERYVEAITLLEELSKFVRLSLQEYLLNYRGLTPQNMAVALDVLGRLKKN